MWRTLCNRTSLITLMNIHGLKVHSVVLWCLGANEDLQTDQRCLSVTFTVVRMSSPRDPAGVSGVDNGLL